MDKQNKNSVLTDFHVLHKNRPLSPHLSIYKPQLTSVLSILHRLTGAYLYLGLIIFSWFLFTLTYFPTVIEDYALCLDNCLIAKFITKLMLFGWSFALFYHLLNGIRHLFWDIGKGFELKTTYFTGKLVVIFAILFTFISWFIACNYTPPKEQEHVNSETIIIENTDVIENTDTIENNKETDFIENNKE